LPDDCTIESPEGRVCYYLRQDISDQFIRDVLANRFYAPVSDGSVKNTGLVYTGELPKVLSLAGGAGLVDKKYEDGFSALYQRYAMALGEQCIKFDEVNVDYTNLTSFANMWTIKRLMSMGISVDEVAQIDSADVFLKLIQEAKMVEKRAGLIADKDLLANVAHQYKEDYKDGRTVTVGLPSQSKQPEITHSPAPTVPVDQAELFKKMSFFEAMKYDSPVYQAMVAAVQSLQHAVVGEVKYNKKGEVKLVAGKITVTERLDALDYLKKNPYISDDQYKVAIKCLKAAEDRLEGKEVHPNTEATKVLQSLGIDVPQKKLATTHSR
jgi:hypothetical protein